MKPVADSLYEGLDQLLAESSFPLPVRLQRVFDTAQQLLSGIANGYKTYINDESSIDNKPNPKDLSLAVHRTLRFLHERLVLDAKIYSISHEQLWSDIHQLYLFAEQQHIQQKSIKDSSHKAVTKSTIEDVYKQCCLFALCRPESLHSNEAEQLRAYLETVSSNCNVSTSQNPDNNGFLYMTDLESDDPPLYTPSHEVIASPETRYLEIGSLLSQLEKHIRQIEKKGEYAAGKKGTLSAGLSKRIFKNLTIDPNRKDRRVNQQFVVYAAVGLKHIYRAIEEGRSRAESETSKPSIQQNEIQAPPPTNSKTAKLKTAKSTIQPRQENDLSMLLISDNARADKDTEQIPTTTAGPRNPKAWQDVPVDDFVEPAPSAQAEKPRQTQNVSKPDSWQCWQVINMSNGGYSLLLGDQQTSQAQVGELITLRKRTGKEYQWAAGIIRRMKYEKNQGVEIGIEMISPELSPASAQPKGAGMHGTIKTLVAQTQTNTTPRLLAPAGQLSSGEKIALSVNKHRLELELSQTGDQSKYFDQFDCKVL